MTKAKVTVRFPKTDTLIKQLGFGIGGKVQKLIDSEVVSKADDFAPSDTTETRKSVYKRTKFGSGKIIYDIYGNVPGRNIWNDTRENVHWQDAPLRGPFWVLRMWAAGGKESVMLAVRRLLSK
jgi:hypothetical protein